MRVNQAGLAAVFVSSLFMARANAAEPKLDGKDCANFPWIKPNACESWKSHASTLPQGPWSKWDRRTGYVRTLFRNRGDRVPGIDLRMITSEKILNDAALRALLEAYARKRLRAHIDEFGFEQNLQDLVFSDFRRTDPVTTPVAVVQSDGSIGESTVDLAGTINLRFQQVLRKGNRTIPVEAAEVDLFLTDDNDLLGITSRYVPNANIGLTPAVSEANAVGIALADVGFDLSDLENPATSLLVALQIPDPELVILRLAWQIALTTQATSVTVYVDAQTGELLTVRTTTADAECTVCKGEEPIPSDPLNLDVFGTVIADDLVLAAADCTNCLGVYDRHEEKLDFLISPGQFGFKYGYFASIYQRAKINGQLLPPAMPTSQATTTSPFRFDFSPFITRTCVENAGGVQTCGPIPTPQIVAQRHNDEVLAYRNVSRIAYHFYRAYGFRLGRAENTRPTLPVHVNYPGLADIRGRLVTGTMPWLCGTVAQEVIDHTIKNVRCSMEMRLGETDAADDRLAYRLIDQPPIAAGVPFIETRIRRDWSKEAELSMHEFGHAVLWDLGLEIGDGDYPIEVSVPTLDYPLGEKVIPIFDYPLRFTSAVHEGTADFYALDYLNSTGAIRPRSVFSPWTGIGRDLNPPGAERIFPQDLTGPANLPTSPDLAQIEVHRDGQIWSGAWWDLRARAFELQRISSIVPTAERAPTEVSALSFHFASYSPSNLDITEVDTTLHGVKIERTFGFQNGLIGVLLSDQAKSRSLYTYETLAAFAWHGIQLEDPLSILVPNPIATSSTSGSVGFDLFLGTNDSYRIVLSSLHDVLDGTVAPDFQGADRNALCVTSYFDASGSCSQGPVPGPLSPTSFSGTQRYAHLTIDPVTVEDLVLRHPALLAPAQPLFGRALTWRSGSTRQDERDSHVEGAGEFILGKDDPFSLYTPSTSAGCACSLVWSRKEAGGVPLILFVGALFLAWRRRAA